MDLVNLMFLAMAGMVIFLSCIFISNWARSHKTRHDRPNMPEFIPPRKRTVSGKVQTRDAATELNYRMADWQNSHQAISRPASGSSAAGQRPFLARDRSTEVEGLIPRLH